MKKVLIALDYDPTAQKVAETGFAMAKAMKAEVILLHVISDQAYYSAVEYSPIMGFNGYTNVLPSQTSESIAAIKESSLHFLDKTRNHLGDKTIQTVLGDGDYDESILKVAKDMHADIIVLGTHSRRWLENVVMGSVTEKVLHHTTIPLFIVPTKKHV